MAARLVLRCLALLARPAGAHGCPNPTTSIEHRYAARRTTLSHYVWIAPLVALALSQVAVIATSVYLHRGLAHRAIRLHPAMDVCFRAVLWITTGQSRREWVAVHRKHHAFTDRPGDPHSPRMLGFWRVQLLNVYYYIREARNPDTIRTFARDIVDDRLDRVLFSRGLSGVALGYRAIVSCPRCMGGPDRRADARGPVRLRPGSADQWPRALARGPELLRKHGL